MTAWFVLATFANALWQGAVVWFAVSAVLRRFRIGQPAMRARFWSVAFFATALTPFAAFVPRAKLGFSPINPISPVGSVGPMDTVTRAPSLSPIPGNIHAFLSSLETYATSSFPPLSEGLAEALLLVWLFGVLRGLTRLGTAVARTKRIRNAGRSVASEELGVPTWIDVRVVRDAASPFATGIFRPAIIIPEWLFRTYPSAAAHGAITHEMAHLRRRDPLVHLIEHLTLIVVWWNPFLRLMQRSISENREMACDDFATTATGDPTAMAECLIACAEQTRRHQPPLLGVYADRGRLSRRIRRLLLDGYHPDQSTGRRAAAAATATIGAVLAGVVVATPPVATAAPAFAMVPASRSIPRPSPNPQTSQTHSEELGRQLVAAIAGGKEDEARSLLAAGADINAVLERDGTPLIAAVNRGCLLWVRTLIRRGANIETYALYDETALISAVRKQDERIVRELLAAGADANHHAETQHGVVRSPLGEARRLRNRTLEAMLIRAGAKQT